MSIFTTKSNNINVSKVLAAAGFPVSSAETKTLMTAIEKFQAVTNEVTAAKDALANAEAAIVELTVDIETTKNRVGTALVSGSMTDDEGLHAIREARSRVDLHESKIGALRRRVESFNDELQDAAAAAQAARNEFVQTLRPAIRRRLAEVAAPFAAAWRAAIAINAEFGLGMLSLTETVVHDPDGAFLGADFAACGIEDAFEHSDTQAICDALQPFRATLAHADQIVREAENQRRAESLVEANNWHIGAASVSSPAPPFTLTVS